MLNQHSLEEIGDIHNLLEDIKKDGTYLKIYDSWFKI
jgi:ABC-type amino acid transport substrate-binding protein